MCRHLSPAIKLVSPSLTFKRAVIPALCVALLAGCAARPPRPTLDEIVQLSREGIPAQTLVEQLQKSRAVWPLTASQILSLRDEGVDVSVLDYLQGTYVEAIRNEERLRHDGSFWWRHCFGCYHRPLVVVAPK